MCQTAFLLSNCILLWNFAAGHVGPNNVSTFQNGAKQIIQIAAKLTLEMGWLNCIRQRGGKCSNFKSLNVHMKLFIILTSLIAYLHVHRKFWQKKNCKCAHLTLKSEFKNCTSTFREQMTIMQLLLYVCWLNLNI